MFTREHVEHVVAQHPGIGFRDLQRKTGLAVGTLQYHIDRSERITREKEAVLLTNQCDSCALKACCRERCILKILRDPQKQTIIRHLAAGNRQADIAARLDLDRSTISYHVSKLRSHGVLVDDRVVQPVRELVEHLDPEQ